MNSLRNDVFFAGFSVNLAQNSIGKEHFQASLNGSQDADFQKVVESAVLQNGFAQGEELYLWGKKLTYIPAMIGDMLWLKRLSLSDNLLCQLPDEIGTLKNLVTFCASDNRLRSLPQTIGALGELRKLALDKNCLTKLPESLGKLNKLRQLLLAHNQLPSLPSSLCDLTMLEELDLAHNGLKSLPDRIGLLSGLRKLDLRGNPLITLPDSISALRNCTINIEGCHIPPHEIRRLQGLLSAGCTLVFPPDLLSDFIEEHGYSYPVSHSLQQPVKGLGSSLSEIVEAWLPHYRQDYWCALDHDLTANGDLKKILFEALINIQEEEEEESRKAVVKAVQIFLQDLERDVSLRDFMLARIRASSGEYGQSRSLSVKDLISEVSRYKASRQAQEKAKKSLNFYKSEAIGSVPVKCDLAKPKRSWFSRLFGCVKL